MNRVARADFSSKAHAERSRLRPRPREICGWPSKAPTASAQFRQLVGFVNRHERLPRSDDPALGDHMRARGAILGALAALADAHAAHDDEPLLVTELANTVRRWIEGQTFSPRTGTEGLTLLDARAAAYADVRRGAVDWSGRERLARADSTEHLLPGLASRSARLAERNRPAHSGARAIQRSAPAGAKSRLDLHLHARRRRDCSAVGVPGRRRDARARAACR